MFYQLFKIFHQIHMDIFAINVHASREWLIEKAEKAKMGKEYTKASEEKEVKSGPKTSMTFNEALIILQVPENYDLNIVNERFNKLFSLNDPIKGGSFYIQCKILGARTTLVEELKRKTGKDVEADEEALEKNTEKKDE